jgi:hypothetical protein
MPTIGAPAAAVPVNVTVVGLLSVGGELSPPPPLQATIAIKTTYNKKVL